MMLKLLFLAMLALTHVACEPFSESKSAASIRAIKAEYIKVQMAKENVNSAFRNTETIARELTRIMEEAANRSAMRKIVSDLELAMLNVDNLKLEMEAALIDQKSFVTSSQNVALANAYKAYVDSYTIWNLATKKLLTNKSELTKASVELAVIKVLSREEIIAFLQSKVVKLEVELVKEKQILNDYKNIDIPEGTVAQLLEECELLVKKLDVKVGKLQAEILVDQESFDIVKNEMISWSDNYGSNFSNRIDALVADTLTIYDNTTFSKTVSNTVDIEDSSYKVFLDSSLDTKVNAISSQYLAWCSMNKVLRNEMSVVSVKKTILTSEINELSHLQFLLLADVKIGVEAVKKKMEDLIDNKSNTVTDLAIRVTKAKGMLANAQSGSYSDVAMLNDLLNDLEYNVTKLEADVIRSEVEVTAAKSCLDITEESYREIIET